jgi:hypothetical protein
MLSRDEYEERRRRIDEDHEATIALIEAGRLAQIRALDLVWLAAAVGGVPHLPQVEALALGSPRLLETGATGERSVPAPAAVPEPSAPPPRRKAWDVIGQIEQVFEELPEVFDHHDLNRALGYELDRGIARRNLKLLIDDGVLAPEDSENGRPHLCYRKLCAKIPEDIE